MQQLADEFLRLGHKVTVVASQAGVDDPSPFEKNGIRMSVHPDFLSRKPMSLVDPLRYPWRLERFLRSRTVPDLVIAMHYAYAIAARRAWPRVSILYLPGGTLWDWIHDQYGFRSLPSRWLTLPIKRPAGWLAEWRSLLMANETLVESDYLADRFRSLYPGSLRIQLLPVPVDIVRFHPDPQRRATVRSELNIPQETRIILALGRLDGRKNYKTLLHAARQLRNSNWVILMAGTGPEESDLRELASNLPVQFLGHRSDPEVLYSAADIYVQPSFWESYSNTVQEATASGAPSIISDRINRGLTDGRNALLADPDNASDWAEKIDRLLSDSELRLKLSTEARRFGESRPTWTELARWLLNRATPA